MLENLEAEIADQLSYAVSSFFVMRDLVRLAGVILVKRIALSWAIAINVSVHQQHLQVEQSSRNVQLREWSPVIVLRRASDADFVTVSSILGQFYVRRRPSAVGPELPAPRDAALKPGSIELVSRRARSVAAVTAEFVCTYVP